MTSALGMQLVLTLATKTRSVIQFTNVLKALTSPIKSLTQLCQKEKQIEIKNGKRRIADKKIFQGYVLVEMRLSDETWYIIRNTPGVTGFVGTGTQPTPVSEKEIEKIKRRMGVEDPKFTVNYEIGEVVSVTDGPFKGFEGTISEIDGKNGKLKLMISMFGRDTAVELDALQVKKIDD